MNDHIQKIFDTADYCTLATICSDGNPWNVPVRLAFDGKNKLYFRSPRGTKHGDNIGVNAKVSVVLLDTSQSVKGALYIQTSAHKLAGKDRDIAINVFNKRFNNPPDQWDETDYFGMQLGRLDESRSVGKMYYFREANS